VRTLIKILAYGLLAILLIPVLAVVLSVLVSLSPFLLAIAIVWGLVRLCSRSEATPIRDRANPEESRMIQEMYHGFNRMAERVEALETILLDRPPVARRARRRDHSTVV
jgi:phage shock protein B